MESTEFISSVQVNDMNIVFETKRLVVKRFTETNQEEFFLVNGDPEVMKYIRPAKTREQTNEFLMEVINYYNQTIIYGRWGVWEKSSNQFVGSFALIPVEHSDKMQLGYALIPAFWGLGFASELTRAGIEYTFTKTPLQEVFGYTEKENISSQKVLEKTGFVFNGENKEGSKIIFEYVMRSNTIYQ